MTIGAAAVHLQVLAIHASGQALVQPKVMQALPNNSRNLLFCLLPHSVRGRKSLILVASFSSQSCEWSDVTMSSSGTIRRSPRVPNRKRLLTLVPIAVLNIPSQSTSTLLRLIPLIGGIYSGQWRRLGAKSIVLLRCMA